ncbi:MAG: hypothetical protein IRY83_12240 [Chloroflexi bacterium]|nr:hypothetical protein [Chloroflexota bacterium]
MSFRGRMVRQALAVLLVLLGLVIVVRGLLEMAPASFPIMGLLMILLGLYRLHLLRWSAKGDG